MKRFIQILLGGLIIFTLVGVPKDLKADDSYQTYDLQQAYYNQQAEYQWSTQLVAYSKTLVGRKKATCVLGLRNYFGVPRSEVQGLAKNTKINSQTGKVGAIVVFKHLSWAGHVAYQITPVDLQGNYQYVDFNGDWKRNAAIRTINVADKRISGYRIY